MGCWAPIVEAAGSGASKRIEINKSDQMLRAYEGDEVVFQSRVSTGKEGRRTPNGKFAVEGKERMHYSRLYENAPMPYSVQISGNYFIHGFKSVPKHPASHGCIRMPIAAAQQLYGWVEEGTPVSIVGKWTG